MLIKFSIYLLLLLIVSLIGVVRYKSLTTPFKILALTLVVSFISESTALILGFTLGVGLPVYHVYVILSFAFYSLVFWLLFKSICTKKIIVYTIVIFAILSILNSKYFQSPFKDFPSNSISLSSMLLVLYTLLYLKNIVDENVESGVYRKSYFIFSISILIYFSTQIFNWGIYNHFLKNKIDASTIDNFVYFMSMIYYAVLGYCLKIDQKIIVKENVA